MNVTNLPIRSCAAKCGSVMVPASDPRLGRSHPSLERDLSTSRMLLPATEDQAGATGRGGREQDAQCGRHAAGGAKQGRRQYSRRQQQWTQDRDGRGHEVTLTERYRAQATLEGRRGFPNNVVRWL